MTFVRGRDVEARWQRICTEMARNAYFLGRRGSIVAKWTAGGRRWVLRFATPDKEGRLIHRSIYIGSDDASELLRRTRERLQHYHRLAEGLEEIPLLAQLTAGAAAILLRRRCSKRVRRKPMKR